MLLDRLEGKKEEGEGGEGDIDWLPPDVPDRGWEMNPHNPNICPSVMGQML